MRPAICLYVLVVLALAPDLAFGQPPAELEPETPAKSDRGASAMYRIERAALRPGGMSESASFRLLGTMGQADAGVLHGPTFRVEGGFWVGEGVAPPLGDVVFSDGFEDD